LIHVGQHVAQQVLQAGRLVVAVVQQGQHPGLGFGGDFGRPSPGRVGAGRQGIGGDLLQAAQGGFLADGAGVGASVGASRRWRAR
jgi:hypothetical protein